MVTHVSKLWNLIYYRFLFYATKRSIIIVVIINKFKMMKLNEFKMIKLNEHIKFEYLSNKSFKFN